MPDADHPVPPNPLEAYAPDEAMVLGWEASRAALWRFNDLAEPFDDVDPELYRNAVECLDGVHICLAFIAQNREHVLEAIPTDPEYWAAFHETLAGLPLGALPWDDDSFYDEVNRLLKGYFYWFTYNVASTGSFSAEAALQIAVPARRWLGGSGSLIEKMFATASMGVIQVRLPVAMADARANDDEQALERLRDVVGPYSKDERSLGRALYTEHRIETALVMPALNAPREDLTDEDVAWAEPLVTEWADRADLARKGFVEVLRINAASRQLAADRTELSWEGFWGSSDLAPCNTEVALLQCANPYVTTVRTGEVLAQVSAGLLELYRAQKEAGTPSTPAPAHWDWLWQAEDNELCLVPLPSKQAASDFDSGGKACMDYIAPSLVAP